VAKRPTTTQSLCCWIDSRSVSRCYCTLPAVTIHSAGKQLLVRPPTSVGTESIRVSTFALNQAGLSGKEVQIAVFYARENRAHHISIFGITSGLQRARGLKEHRPQAESWICDPCGVSLIPTRCPKFHVSVGDVPGHRRYDPTATDNVLVLFLPTIFSYIMPYPELIQDPSLVRRADLPPTLVSRNDRVERTRGRGQGHESDNTRFQSYECHLGGHTPRASESSLNRDLLRDMGRRWLRSQQWRRMDDGLS
jgi:hypothetical protein